MPELDPIDQARWQGETTQTLRNLAATIEQMAKDQRAANIRREQIDAHIAGEIQRVDIDSRARDAVLERQHAEWRGNLRGFLVGCALFGGGVGGSIVAGAHHLIS